MDMDASSSDLQAHNIEVVKQDGDQGAAEPKQNGVADGHINHSSSNHVSEEKSSEKHRSHSDKHRDKHSHHSSSSSHKHKSSHGDKHRDHKSGSSSSSHKHSSSSSSHKHRDSSSKHHSSSSSSSKDKHSSSSSSSKHRDGHHSSSSSSKDRHHHSSSSKDKHHSSSSSSKHRDSSSSKHHSSDGKHRDGEKSRDKHDKDKEHSNKEKHSSDKGLSNSVKPTTEPRLDSPARPKPEPNLPSPKKVKEEPLVSTVTSETVSPVASPVRVKEEKMEVDSDDEVPLSVRMAQVEKSKSSAEKRPLVESDDDDTPLAARMEEVKKAKKIKEEPSPPKLASPPKKRKAVDEDEDFKHEKKKKKKKEEKGKKVKQETPAATNKSPTKKGKVKKEEQEEKWRWWEEVRVDDGTKWKFLEHSGPVFAPPYEPLPSSVTFYYNGKPMKLSQDTEEVAGFYGRMLEHDYTTKEMFNKNFFKDWKKVMTKEEREIITDLSKCNFKEILVYYQQQSEQRKNRSKEEKKKLKEENEALVEQYGFCMMDAHKEKIGNFKIEPPGLFRGRGDHPKMGMLKKRIMPEDIIINCSKDSKCPQAPEGHRWREVRHDNTVTWLASWSENIQGNTKYIMLNPSSKLKGEKDWQKYETARKLHKLIDRIRAQYREDWKSKEMRVRQRSVALYFIDKLALRAGNEKDEDQADTVGCCSLRVEHLRLSEKLDGLENVVEFDFLGKDSIRYYNRVSVEKRVFKNLQLFMENKSEGDDLFDRLNTAIMNKHLQSLMEGLTAKVFRTYNASRTLQEQLDLLTNPDDPPAAKLLSYNRANRAVAILCNHQRAVPKNFDKQMENLQTKIDAKKDAIKDAKRDHKAAKADAKAMKTAKHKAIVEKKKKAVERLEEQLTKLEVQATDKDENKEIALGTSKLNYLDPRISVAWCKKWEIPIEKIYNKTQRQKFAWAIDMAEEDYKF